MAKQGSRIPSMDPHSWIPAAGDTARMMLPRGQAIPVRVCFYPGNCRLNPACRERAASQRHQVHGRVEL